MKINVVKLVLLLNWSSIFVGKSILIFTTSTMNFSYYLL